MKEPATAAHGGKGRWASVVLADRGEGVDLMPGMEQLWAADLEPGMVIAHPDEGWPEFFEVLAPAEEYCVSLPSL